MKRKITLSLIILFFTSFGLLAQPPDPSTDPDVPIPGIEILIALGGALGVRKFIMNKRKSTS